MLTYRAGTVVGAPQSVVGAGVSNVFTSKVHSLQPQKKKSSTPKENSLPQALNFYADYSGCGFWRMIWPEHLMIAYQKMSITGSTKMIRTPEFYNELKSVRLQRQANQGQLKFFKFLRDISNQHGNNFRLLYEIDDIVLREDIPEYNKYRFAFLPDEIRNSTLEMMRMADEISCTCDYMKQYYQTKTGNDKVTVVPNYLPKMWIDGFYDDDKVQINYDRQVKKRKQPRILYAASGAHFDVENKTNQADDFAHVRDVIRKTCNKYKWVFIGAYPPPLHDLVLSGKIEFHKWVPLYDLPRLVSKLKINCMIAPLLDNTFNKCKSNIKYLEACAYGIPIVCQDLITYDIATHKFKTGDEMIDQLNGILKDKQHYMKISRKARAVAETMWLEDNIDKYVELYCHDYGSKERVALNQINGII